MGLPRVLVLSHTSFTKANSMGSTLASYFSTYDPDCLAQFFIKDMIPDIPVCTHYYCVTDGDLVRKIMHPMIGKVGRSIILNVSKNENQGRNAVASSVGSHRHRNAAQLARKVLWSTKLWDNKQFREWLNAFSPQVILVQPGDFSYLLDMSVYLAKKLSIPIVVHQSESYYLKEYEKKAPLNKLFRHDFRKSYERLMRHTSCCVYLCESLEEGYSRFFDVPAVTIMKSTSIKPSPGTRVFDINNIRFVYGGNLGEKVGRCEPLVELGRVVKKIGFHIDVYTSSTGDHMRELTLDNGIILHGALTYDELQSQIKDSDFIIHLESQKPWNVKDLEYAFSTKIADMLASGVCSVVYGSEKVSSVKYFKEHQLGCVIEKKEDIEPLLRELIADESLRRLYISRALDQAKAAHNPKANSDRMKDIICRAYESDTLNNC